MNKPHKHAALIKAWADGAEIQYRRVGGQNWYLMTDSINWQAPGEFRIKPEKKKCWVKVVKSSYNNQFLPVCVNTSEGKAAHDKVFSTYKWIPILDWFEVEYEDV